MASTPGPSLAEGFGTHVISTADYHTCAVLSDGGAQCWGGNEDGQLGDGTTTERATPVDVCATGATAPCTASDDSVLTNIVGIAAGYEHTCAVTDTGTAKCWGDNEFGQLGNGSLLDSLTPVDVCATGATTPCTAGAGNILTGVATISASMGLPLGYHTCAVMQANGGVKCWGANNFGQLGDGTEILRKTPVDVCATGATAPCGGNILTGAADISVTALWSCALTTASGVKCWGNNLRGQLGDGTLTQRNTPVDVCATGAAPPCTASDDSVLTNIVGIAAGYEHTCAVTDTGRRPRDRRAVHRPYDPGRCLRNWSDSTLHAGQ
jgi:alpha-tubulin suppressor-like RCC1 family protein